MKSLLIKLFGNTNPPKQPVNDFKSHISLRQQSYLIAVHLEHERALETINNDHSFNGYYSWTAAMRFFVIQQQAVDRIEILEGCKDFNFN